MKKNEQCVSCGEDAAIRNPAGKCDHLYYPENINKNEQAEGWKKDLKPIAAAWLSLCTAKQWAREEIDFDPLIKHVDDLLKKQEARIRQEEKERIRKLVNKKSDRAIDGVEGFLVLSLDDYSEIFVQ